MLDRCVTVYSPPPSLNSQITKCTSVKVDTCCWLHPQDHKILEYDCNSYKCNLICFLQIVRLCNNFICSDGSKGGRSRHTTSPSTVLVYCALIFLRKRGGVVFRPKFNERNWICIYAICVIRRGGATGDWNYDIKRQGALVLQQSHPTPAGTCSQDVTLKQPYVS